MWLSPAAHAIRAEIDGRSLTPVGQLGARLANSNRSPAPGDLAHVASRTDRVADTAAAISRMLPHRRAHDSAETGARRTRRHDTDPADPGRPDQLLGSPRRRTGGDSGRADDAGSAGSQPYGLWVAADQRSRETSEAQNLFASAGEPQSYLQDGHLVGVAPAAAAQISV